MATIMIIIPTHTNIFHLTNPFWHGHLLIWLCFPFLSESPLISFQASFNGIQGQASRGNPADSHTLLCSHTMSSKERLLMLESVHVCVCVDVCAWALKVGSRWWWCNCGVLTFDSPASTWISHTCDFQESSFTTLSTAALLLAWVQTK